MTSPNRWSTLCQRVRNHILQQVTCGPGMSNVTQHVTLVLAAAGALLTPRTLSDKLHL
jgi:hypothetical protein